MELHWWLKEIPKVYTNIHLPKVDFLIHTDASQAGWGTTDVNNPTGGVVRKPRGSLKLFRTESYFFSS